MKHVWKFQIDHNESLPKNSCLKFLQEISRFIGTIKNNEDYLWKVVSATAIHDLNQESKPNIPTDLYDSKENGYFGDANDVSQDFNELSENNESDKKFTCHTCGCYFERLCGLKSHMKIHLDDKSSICGEYGKTFQEKLALVRQYNSQRLVHILLLFTLQKWKIYTNYFRVL